MLSEGQRPRVYLDGYPVENRLQRGIARVVTETVSRSCNEIDYTIGHEKPLLYSLGGVSVRPCRRDRREAGEFPRFGLCRSHQTEFPVADREYDVYHSTFFIPCPAQKIHKVQHVYDMIPELLPEIMGRWGRLESKRKAVAISQADTLVCISHATKLAMLQVHPHLQKRIEVVPLGGDHLCHAQEPIAKIVHAPYVLFVGHRHTYKNFDVVLKALASKAWPAGCRLLVVGRPPTIREQVRAGFYGVGSRINWAGYVSDERLAELYNRATAFVFPSRMEGFGIPVLEAQRNFCPLVASDIPVFREVAGNGAVYFMPDDPASLGQAVNLALSDRGLLIERGTANAAKFSWADAAARMIEIYRSCLR